MVGILHRESDGMRREVHPQPEVIRQLKASLVLPIVFLHVEHVSDGCQMGVRFVTAQMGVRFVTAQSMGVRVSQLSPQDTCTI